jgi:hypothetical protein
MRFLVLQLRWVKNTLGSVRGVRTRFRVCGISGAHTHKITPELTVQFPKRRREDSVLRDRAESAD